MLGFMNVFQKDTEKWIGEPTGRCGIGEVGVDDEDGEEGEDDVEAETVEPNVCVWGPDDSVMVTVEEVTVLL
jgi:hypothetical protein